MTDKALSFKRFKTIRETKYFRSLEIDPDVSWFDEEGWRVQALAVENGIPHFVLVRERIEEMK